MFVDTFMMVSVSGLSLESLATTYAEWVLGQGNERRAGPDRIKKGVNREWTAERVLSGEPLVGHHGCRVDMRLDDTNMLIRFVHRDTQFGAIFWNSSARVRREGDRLIVEHAVGRDPPRGYALSPVAAPPRIITSLLDKDGVDVQPRQLALQLVKLSDGGARGFVEHELLNTQRQVPVLVVSCDRGGGPPVVDPQKLAQKLRGIAAVAYLTSDRSTFEFSDALAEHGFGPEYRCYNGAVHSYGPVADLHTDHRLWLATSIAGMGDNSREDKMAGILSHRLGARSMPSGFFQLIEEHDREERRRTAERLSRKPSNRPASSSTSTVPASYVASIEKEKNDLRHELHASIQREKEYLEAWNRSDDERRMLESEREDAEAKLEQERLVSSELRETIQRIKQNSSSGISEQESRAIRAILVGRCTPLDCLVAVGLLHRDRIVVLDSAYSSAEKVADFKHGKKLFELLQKLATSYFDALAQGKGDTEAGNIFGESFAATESESTKKNKRAIKERTFLWDGKPITMWSHIKIGVKESVSETIRVHFEWAADNRLIVIGWCGEHRYRVG